MFNFGRPASAGSNPSSGLFGQNNNSTNNAGPGGGFNFGQPNNNANTNNNGRGGFSFGNQNQGSITGGGLFGAKSVNNSGTTGGGFSFGKPVQSSTGGTGLFNSATNNSGGAFGNANNSGNGLFGNTNANTSNAGGSSLFGNTNNNSTTGGLFGNAGTNNNTNGLFGNANASNGGLFGNTNNGGRGGGLFGNTSTNTSGNGLFGNTNNNSTGTGSGLFGNTSNNNNNSTGAGGGLFGSKPTGSSLFGSTDTNTNNTSLKGGGMFGNAAGNNNASGGSLFGNTNGNSSNSMGGGIFGSKPAGGSLFGNGNALNTNGSLFGTQPVQQNFSQPAINSISQLPITTMTRIVDLPPQLRQEIEQLDQYVQRQVQISQHLKADTAEHTELIGSVPRDIIYLLKFESLASQSLAQDLRKLTSIKEITDANLTDTQIFAIILQQLLTPGSKISSTELDKFFHHKLQIYQYRLDEYFRVLSDIESAVNGIDSDIFGSGTGGFQGGSPSDSLDVFAMKTGLNALVSTMVEEFQLFMDTAERIAELHQKVKESTADRLTI